MSHIVDRPRQQLAAFSPRRRISMILLVLAAFTMVGTAARAYWTTTGAGAASASTGTINAPTNAAAVSTPGGGVVAVSWTNSTPAAGISPTGYYVTRVRNSDSATFNACGSTATSATASTPCNDNGVADGTYHYVVTAVKATWTAASGSSNNVTVINDNVAPVVTLTTPVNGSSGNSTTPTLSGVAGNVVGDSASVTVKIYNGSGTGGAVAQTIPVARAGAAWATTAAPLAQGTYTAQATQTDTAGNTGTSTANTFTVDTAAPLVTLTTPVNGSSGNSTTPTLSGVAGNVAGDSATVTIKIYNGIGTGGAVAQTLTPTRTGATWTATAAALAQGTYTAQATQTDTAGNTGTSTANTFTVDTAAPTVASVLLANGGTVGQADKGDKVTITYSEPMDAATFCTNWTNSGTQIQSGNGNVIVTITDAGANDVLTVTASNCPGGLKVGGFALGANYVGANTNFGAPGNGNDSTVSLTTAGVLTLTLGNGSGSATGVANSSPIYTPISGLKDLAGNALSISPFAGSSSKF